MTIGDFSRATRLSAKALRFYHQQGILRPAEINPDNGYRWYDVDQIVDAQVVRQLRALEVPVDTVRELLGTEDVVVRNELIAAHLLHLEARLDATRAAVASLRGLLEPTTVPLPIEHRSVPATPALVVRDTIDLADLGSWYSSAWSMLDDAESMHEGRTTGPRGGLWDTDLFLQERGEALLYSPIDSMDASAASSGMVHVELLPEVDLAVLVHRGLDDTMANSYGILGAHVAAHEIGVDGPIREVYVQVASSTSPEVVTEIGWPIFRTAL
jgi:DNA-binding transcriptional MerR regulator